MGASPCWKTEVLRRLTDGIGGRVTGSPEMAKAVDWAVAAFRAEGVTVHTEKYQLAHSWSEGETRLEPLDGAEKFPVRLVAAGWSPALPAGGIEANVIYVGAGTEEDFSRTGAGLKGSILLVSTKVGVTWADLFDEYAQPLGVIERAVKGGAAGGDILVDGGVWERLLLYRHTNSRAMRTAGNDSTGDFGARGRQAMRSGEQRREAYLAGKVQVRFSMPNKIGGPVEQENVVGEIAGYEKPDEAVILGAHLDSWDLGTWRAGLQRMGNAALVIEAARVLKATGLRPRRTIRFVLFSGEEQGMSWARVRMCGRIARSWTKFVRR